jgi:hypothetical protein
MPLYNTPCHKISPSWKGEGWYKFAYPAGTKMSTTPTPVNSCSTTRGGYMVESHPTQVGQTKNVKFCFNWSTVNHSCYWPKFGEVKKCGEGDFVYKLPNTGSCSARYCAVP